MARHPGVLDRFDPGAFREYCRTDRPDLIRLKVDVRDALLFQSLKDTGMPSELFTINTLFVSNIDPAVDYRKEIPGNISCRAVSGHNREEFRQVLRKVLDTRGWYAYKGALGEALIPPSVSEELSMAYFSSFADGGDKLAWLLDVDGQCVGIYMGQISGNRMHGTLYGILEAHRSAGYSKAMYGFMYTECQQRGITEFSIEVHFQNHSSIESARRSYMKPETTYFNVLVFPLLSLETAGDRTTTGVAEAQTAMRGYGTWSRAVIDESRAPDRGESVILLRDGGQHFQVVHWISEQELVGAEYRYDLD